MKAIIPEFKDNSTRPCYLQLYDHIKQEILKGNIQSNEKLPSLRALSTSLKLSITTIEQAYNQLSVEGYIYSKPQSGYFASEISYESAGLAPMAVNTDLVMETREPAFLYDLSCFDFNKWKKCLNKVLTEYSSLLLFESDPQGEAALRYEISKYVYRSRGVTCTPEQIVIGAGTQQITSHLSMILGKMAVNHVAVEEPGYLPVKNIFRDRGFLMTPVAVTGEGIDIGKLPSNIRSAVYVCPSNQFPTGAVMPIGKRYELLDWAIRNHSIIIEDDYDSELRYFGKPVPALQGLDSGQHVVYLGSFSSTLFASLKISYMVLPRNMAEIFQAMRGDYTQTCSKTEQLTLAIFMEQGLYQTNLKKLRSLYSQKLQAAIGAINKWGKDFVRPTNTTSGINMIINVKSLQSAEELCEKSKSLGILTIPVAAYTEGSKEASSALIFYYNQIPLSDMNDLIEALICAWRRP